MTREIRNPFKFRRVGPARWWHDALLPLVRITRFLPVSWPVQRSSVEVTSTFRPSHLPWWRLTSHTLIIPHACCPVVAVSSQNLVPRDGTMVCSANITLLIFHGHMDGRYKRSLLNTMVNRAFKLSSTWELFH